MAEESAAKKDEASQPTNPFREIVQPFIDLASAPQALWAVNLAYMLEGMVYFGMLGYLAMYFNQYVGLDDVWAGIMVGTLTWGITFSMFFFGGLADRWGVRIALIAALGLMLFGRVLLAGGATAGLAATGLGSTLHIVALFGILLVGLGYGMYQPAAYATIRQVTTPKTAAMGYAMLYAGMNLGGWLPTFFGPIRRTVGIGGAYWVYCGVTVVTLALTALLLTKKAIKDARAKAEAGGGGEVEDKDGKEGEDKKKQTKEPFSLVRWLTQHPLADAKFAFFIFCLIPVQTLFAHNWLTLPMYVERAYAGSWLGTNFEAAVNFNPLLIFILVPIVTAVTRKANVYKMMVLGTFIMAVPTFLLALGANFWTLLGYLLIMTVGEAMWQPRFLQYAAEIAPPGRTGAYMGVAQFPWFLTKVITSFYSGWFLTRFCPAGIDIGVLSFHAPKEFLNTESMWLIYGGIAITSSMMLVAAKGWLGKDFKTKAAA